METALDSLHLAQEGRYKVNGLSLTFTDEWATFLGYDLDELIKNWLEYIHPDDKSGHELAWSMAWKERKSTQFDCRWKCSNGAYRWFLTSIVPCQDDDICSAVSIDITDLKQQHERDLTHYEMLNLIVHSLHVMISYIDADLRYVYVNRAYEDVFGLRKREIRGKHVSELLGKEHVESIQGYIDLVLSGEKVSYEERLPPRFGAQWLSVTLLPHMDDSPTGPKVKGIFVWAELIGADRLCSENVERFISHWQDRPEDLCCFIGKVVGRITHQHLPLLYREISTSYFAYFDIAERIDFLYDHYLDILPQQTKRELNARLEIEMNQNVLCLHDISTDNAHNAIRIMLIRDIVGRKKTYSIRPFVVRGEGLGFFLKSWRDKTRPTFRNILAKIDSSTDEQQYEELPMFWNFRPPDDPMDGVEISHYALAFDNLTESINVARMVRLASRLFGHA